VIKLDFYMLEAACRCIRNWIDTGLSPIPISVNFSRLHLQDEHFVEKLSEIVNKYAISPSLIEVELTESTVLNNEGVLIDVISQLHSYGFSLSIDDFGSGYSSLGLLKNLAVDIIKLDRTFFAQYSDLRRAKIVIHSMISMAKQLGIYTVAEGVETKENIALLDELGCDIVQGYYYARPMPSDKLQPFLSKDCNVAEAPRTSLKLT
ncbi:MAG: EAL domain-containing protein, partial [Oscillospiraceae bacterium]